MHNDNMGITQIREFYAKVSFKKWENAKHKNAEAT